MEGGPGAVSKCQVCTYSPALLDGVKGFNYLCTQSLELHERLCHPPGCLLLNAGERVMRRHAVNRTDTEPMTPDVGEQERFMSERTCEKKAKRRGELRRTSLRLRDLMMFLNSARLHLVVLVFVLTLKDTSLWLYFNVSLSDSATF